MKSLRVIIVFLLGLTPIFAMGAVPLDSIAASINTMMIDYPESTLLDIYKSAFQNRYGPGHIVADTARAKNYLDWELDQPVRHINPLYEPTLPDGCFYRVNLSVITDSIIPYSVFFEAFLDSVHDIEMPDITKWAEDWAIILDVINSMGLVLPDYDVDVSSINERLIQGIYAGEHSQRFVDAYDPHYRIIRKDIFETRLKPVIDGHINSSLNN